MSVAIVWFRQDLRLSDNPALTAAIAAADTIIPVFIDDPADRTASQIGAASRVWLHHSLQAFNASLAEHATSLVCRRGPALDVLQALAEECGATRIFWNRCHDPDTIARDTKIKTAFKSLEAATSNALLVFEPWQVLKKDGTPYKVYTPYWRAAAQAYDAAPDAHVPLPAPKVIPGGKVVATLAGQGDIDTLGLLPSDKVWHEPMIEHWSIGEAAAQARLDAFLAEGVHGYDDGRNLPGESGTSRLSPHLHHGEISPRQILARLAAGRALSGLGEGETTFAKEVFWREFGYALLFHFPDSITEPLDRRFSAFPWRKDAKALRAWQRGMTGVPIVDAGMRELYATGWMHNRVRMIVASYLIKNLLLPWQAGEAWFRDTLVDADLASNAMGWQWTAGSGADAAPFFRVFNPVLQGERFDKQGSYVRQWVPELADVPNKFLHKPWELPAEVRDAMDYPAPLVDLKATRQRALDAFATIKN